MLIYLIAGEPSGDLLGARLIRALKRATEGGVTFAGIGGPEMEKEGLKSLFPIGDLAIMGLTEVVPHVPRVLKRLRQTEADIREREPVAVVTIDSPGFTFRVARRLQDAGIPLIHYVAPTVWAWRPRRAQKTAKLFDHLMVLLPFEPPFFTREGLNTTFVGHPVVEDPFHGDGEKFRRAYGIDLHEKVLLMLPGSRAEELKNHLPVFRDTAVRIRRQFPGLKIVMPAVSHIASDLRRSLRDWKIPVIVLDDIEEKPHAFAAADVALSKSGTVTLELAIAGVPTVVTHRVHSVTAWLVRRLLHTRWFSLVNILEEGEIIPECIQAECNPAVLSSEIKKLLDHPINAQNQRISARRALARLHPHEGGKPSERAADVVLDAIGYERPEASRPRPTPLSETEAMVEV